MKLTTLLLLATIATVILADCVQDDIMKAGKGGSKVTFLAAPVDDTRTEGFCNAEWKTNKTCCEFKNDDFLNFAKSQVAEDKKEDKDQEEKEGKDSTHKKLPEMITKAKAALLLPVITTAIKTKFTAITDAMITEWSTVLAGVTWTADNIDAELAKSNKGNSECAKAASNYRRQFLCFRCSGRASTFFNAATKTWSLTPDTCYENMKPCLDRAAFRARI